MLTSRSVFLGLLSTAILFTGCLDSQYSGPSNYPNNGYPQYPNSYPNYPTNYPNNYPINNYPYYPPPQQVYPQQGYPPPGYRYPNNNHNHRRDDKYPRRDNNSQIHRPHVNQPRPIPVERQPSSPSPSCPPGTQFTGRTCKIIDSKLRKPGGDGNINPCPKGMWISGNKCVGN